ncbi:hypothetical protein ACTMTU_18310 [Streptomyces sp. OZ13]|uniref:hypothetical protein n=1 Tax=Streptomyces sp. OZ13 TaxID=3452210 RepID=UPI003F8A118C
MRASTRAWGALLALACLVGTTACSQEAPSDGGGADARESGTDGGKPKGVGDEFPDKNVIISAGCTPGTKGEDAWYGGVVTVDAWEPGSWKHVAHTEFRLPDTALVGMTDNTAVEGLCLPAETGEVPSMRSLFDRDFTKIAVVTEDPQTGETHVGYVDRAGRFTDLTGEADFGEDPTERSAAFSPEGDHVWLTYEGDSGSVVASRSVDGDHELVDHGRTKDAIARDLTLVGTPSKVVVGGHVTLSPDGKHMTTGSAVVRVPQEDVIDAVAAAEGGDVIAGSGCQAVGWIDNDTVLCDEATNYSTAQLGPEARHGKPILPESSTNLFTMASSPDGKQISFISEDGDRYEHWIAATTQGSTPQKVEPGGDFAALGSTPVFIDWR